MSDLASGLCMRNKQMLESIVPAATVARLTAKQKARRPEPTGFEPYKRRGQPGATTDDGGTAVTALSLSRFFKVGFS